MARFQSVLFFLPLLLSVCFAVAQQSHDVRTGESEVKQQQQLKLERAQQVLETDGGSMWVWKQEIEAIRNMAVGIAELQLLPNGLLLPNYADSPKLAFVLQGRGYMGAVFPGVGGEVIQPYVRQVKKGDVIALPKGTVHWWYNDGEDVHHVLFAADTSLAVQHGYYSSFILAGGERRHFGSLLHGFSRGALATAWGVDKEYIGSLLESQSEVSIVRVSQPIRFPGSYEEESMESGRQWRRYHESVYDERNVALEDQIHSHLGDAPVFGELKYTSPRNQPDFFRQNGGFINVVDFRKLPALRNIGFSIAEVSLEKNAMFAPSFISNAHELIYVTRGDGRIEISSGDGEKVFDEEVYEGLFIVVPQYFPSIKIAGNKGLEWVSILTSERPLVSFLAGTNSVYHGIPRQVLANAFNVNEETIDTLGRPESIIFPHDEEVPPRRKEQVSQTQRQQTKHGKLYSTWLDVLSNAL